MRPLVLLLLAASPALGQTPEPSDARVEILRRFDRPVNLADLGEKTTFDAVRKLVEEKLGGKVVIRLDERAFADSIDAIRSAPVQVPKFGTKMPAARALLLAVIEVKNHLKHLPAIEFLPVPPDTLLITSAERSMSIETYDLRPVLREADGWLDGVRQMLAPGSGRRREEIDADSPAELLTGLLVANLSSESVGRLENDEKLIVRTTPSGHQAIASHLEALTRLADVRVRMKASLYELEPADFEKWVAPLLAEAAKNGEPRAVFPLRRALREFLAAQSPLLIGTSPRFHNGAAGMFLSRKWAQRTPVPRVLAFDDGSGEKVLVTHLVGLTLSARATVGADRRSLVLDITQKTTLVDLKRDSRPQPSPQGVKQVEVILPEPRTRTASETVRADDGEPLLIVIQQPLRDALGGGRWVVVLEPQVSIDAEERVLSVMPERVK